MLGRWWVAWVGWGGGLVGGRVVRKEGRVAAVRAASERIVNMRWIKIILVTYLSGEGISGGLVGLP